MTLNTHKFSLAATITMGITYVICTVFTLFFPDIALKFLGWMMHLVNVEKIAGGVEVTIGGFLLGFLPILFYTYIGTYVFARLYNRLIQS